LPIFVLKLKVKDTKIYS